MLDHENKVEVILKMFLCECVMVERTFLCTHLCIKPWFPVEQVDPLSLRLQVCRHVSSNQLSYLWFFNKPNTFLLKE